MNLLPYIIICFHPKLFIQSDTCIESCSDYDQKIWEENYKQNLTATGLEEYEALTGSEKTAKWNPNNCNIASFKAGLSDLLGFSELLFEN